MSKRTVIRLLAVGIPSLLLLAFLAPSVVPIGKAQDIVPPAGALPSPAPQYYSPLQNAQLVSKGASIIVRYGPVLTRGDVNGLQFVVRGSRSGTHSGDVVLADDQRTVLFKPDKQFTPGEKVAVNISALKLAGQTPFRAISYSFSVAVNQQPGTPGSSQLADPPIPPKPPRSAFPDFLTVPQDIPHFEVSVGSADPSEGDLFVAPFYWTESTVGSYLLILDRQGKLVYYRSVADALDAWDFKVQPNGLLSYYDQKNSIIYVMDSHYRVVDTYQAGDGYSADLHDFQLLPNGNALLMIYDAETIDMGKYIWGGQRAALVTGLVIQEMDPSKNVIFEWRSWDHFSLHDSIAKLTTKDIDLIHANSLALTADGNLLLSSRNLNEVTKIDLQTGDIIWRLGGKSSMFKFVNGEPFAYQHDVRELPNGNITVFDNHGTPDGGIAPSRGVEYQLDLAEMTATQVWEYAADSHIFGTYMGNTQRLANGNTLLSWGAPYTKSGYQYRSVTEVDPENHTVFDLTFDQPYVSYRAFLFPWHGYPDTLPALAFKAEGGSITLGYSWNGATEVAAFRVYGGATPETLSLVDARNKTDFEMHTQLKGLPATECYFQVAALDATGKEMARSQIISTDSYRCPPLQ